MIARLSGVLSIGCLLVLAGAASGQVAAPSESDGQPAVNKTDAAPMRGPRVRSTAPPGARGRLVDGQSDRRDRATPLRFYRQELKKMGSADADASIKLSDEQVKEIRSISSDFGDKLRVHMAAHRDEMREMRVAAGLPDEPNQRQGQDRSKRQRGANRDADQRPADAKPDRRRQRPDDAMEPDADRMAPADRRPDAAPGARRQAATPEMKAMRERMAEIRAAGPNESDAIKKIWAVLSTDQQAHLEARAKAAKAQMSDRMEQRGSRPGDAETDGAKRRAPREGAARDGQRRRPDGQQRPTRKPSDRDQP